MMLNMIILD